MYCFFIWSSIPSSYLICPRVFCCLCPHISDMINSQFCRLTARNEKAISPSYHSTYCYRNSHMPRKSLFVFNPYLIFPYCSFCHRSWRDRRQKSRWIYERKINQQVRTCAHINWTFWSLITRQCALVFVGQSRCSVVVVYGRAIWRIALQKSQLLALHRLLWLTSPMRQWGSCISLGRQSWSPGKRLLLKLQDGLQECQTESVLYPCTPDSHPFYPLLYRRRK